MEPAFEDSSRAFIASAYSVPDKAGSIHVYLGLRMLDRQSMDADSSLSLARYARGF